LCLKTYSTNLFASQSGFEPRLFFPIHFFGFCVNVIIFCVDSLEITRAYQFITFSGQHHKHSYSRNVIFTPKNHLVKLAEFQYMGRSSISLAYILNDDTVQLGSKISTSSSDHYYKLTQIVFRLHNAMQYYIE